jgi:hypothetical protein
MGKSGFAKTAFAYLKLYRGYIKRFSGRTHPEIFPLTIFSKELRQPLIPVFNKKKFLFQKLFSSSRVTNSE